MAVRHRIARCFVLLFAAAMAFLIIQEFHGIGIMETFKVEPKTKITAGGKAYTWQLPRRYQGEIMNTRGIALENGVPLLNRAKSNAIVRQKGAGRFRFFKGRLHFSAQDDTDPRLNGRTYEVRVPKQFRPWHFALVGFLLLVSLIAFQITRPSIEEPSAWRSRSLGLQALAVFAIALTLLLIRQAYSAPFTDGAVCLKDVPLSDASGWHQMARGMVEGRGLNADFQNSRPLHPTLLAPIYAITGSTLGGVRAWNCVLLALSATGAWLFGMILRSRWLALSSAILVGILPDHAALTHMVMTENSGMFLAILSALGLLLATWHLSPRWSFAAGLVNGLSCLACGFTLLTLPFYAFVILLNPLLRRAPWKRSVLMAVLFTLGVSVVLLPWMIRQKIVNDRFTITFATADLLYGGANVDEGGFHAQLFREAEKKGVKMETALQRYDYFTAEFKKIVRAAPLAYAGKVARSTLRSFSLIQLMEPEMTTVGLLILGGLALGGTQLGSNVPRLLAVGLMVMVWLRLESNVLLPVCTASWFLTFRRARWPEERLTLVILGLTILGIALLDGVGGNTAPRRFWLTGNWAMAIIILLALVRAVEATEGILTSLMSRVPVFKKLISPVWREGMPRQLENVCPIIQKGLVFALIYASIAIIFTVACSVRGQIKPWPQIGSVETEKVIAEALLDHPIEEVRKGSDRIRSFLARLDDMTIPMRPGEDLGHWLPGLGSREMAHTVASISRLGPDGERTQDAEVIITGALEKIPRGQPLLWLVTEHPEINELNGSRELVCEALGVMPLEKQPDGKWTAAPPIWFLVAPEASKSLRP
jgi:hypothetical protein